MASKRKYTCYTKQFKIDTVKTFLGSGQDIKAFAKKIGVYPQNLDYWVAKYKAYGEDALNGSREKKVKKTGTKSTTVYKALERRIARIEHELGIGGVDGN